MNLSRTRVVLFETDDVVYTDVINTMNPRWFQLVAVVVENENMQVALPCPAVHLEDLLDLSFWDLFVINDCGHTEQIRSIILEFGIPEDRLFFLSHTISDYEFYRNFFLPDSFMGKLADFLSRRIGERYLAVSTRDNTFISNATDGMISLEMFMYRRTYSEDEIELFLKLAEQYYDTSDTCEDYFLDIGANIGTTCIYVKKKLLPDTKIIAFEPVKENYKLLQVNMMLNDITDFQAYNMAVMDDCSTHTMRLDIENWGACSIVEESADAVPEQALTEKVESITIEKFLREQKIDPSHIRYVWIDTEGFETEVLSASRPLLEQRNTAVYMEYAPMLIDVSKMERLIRICGEYFKYFICIDDYNKGDTSPRPIEELKDLYKRYPGVTNVFLIKDCT